MPEILPASKPNRPAFRAPEIDTVAMLRKYFYGQRPALSARRGDHSGFVHKDQAKRLARQEEASRWVHPRTRGPIWQVVCPASQRAAVGTARTDDFVGHTGIGPLSCQPLTMTMPRQSPRRRSPETAAPDGLTPTLFKLLVYGLHDQTKLTREDFREIGARE